MSKALQVAKADSRRGRKTVDRLLRRSELVLDPKTLRRARRLVKAVRKKGDAALLEAARRLDGAKAESVAGLALAPLPEDEGWSNLPRGFTEALQRAWEAVTAFHERQIVFGYSMEIDGAKLEERRTPLRRVGVYVPGGRASYPSTVLMTVVPARLAGVEDIVVVTPPRSYAAMPALRYTLDLLGVKEVWGVGGAHAVSALAYGTKTIERVDKIVGPGNAWVTAGKRLVMGDVAIDGLAGPSEVIIAADGDADPQLLAADLLAQAEHDPRAAAVLLTPERKLAKAVAAAVEEQLRDLPTAETARASLGAFGGALVVTDAEEALALIDAVAPEHLQLVGEFMEALAPQVRNAGAIFLGAETPEVFGDYVAGPSHVLPTCGGARFASALGVEDFIRRSHVVRFSAEAAARRAAHAAALADAEGLPAHAASARRRSP